MAAIADGSLAPGERIVQGELADRLGVSRQPVSHALHLLKREGLVEESGRQGFRVVPVDPARVRQLYEVRAALDELAARAAAARAGGDPAGRAALETAFEAGRRMPPAPAMAEAIRHDTAFHRALYRLSGNGAIDEVLRPHWPHFSRSMAVVLTVPNYRARAWSEHDAILRRVLAGDGEGAGLAARAHALGAGRMTEESLGKAA